MQIINQLGQNISCPSINNEGQVTVDISQIEKGLYTLLIMTDEAGYTSKFVKK